MKHNVGVQWIKVYQDCLLGVFNLSMMNGDNWSEGTNGAWVQTGVCVTCFCLSGGNIDKPCLQCSLLSTGVEGHVECERAERQQSDNCGRCIFGVQVSGLCRAHGVGSQRVVGAAGHTEKGVQRTAKRLASCTLNMLVEKLTVFLYR